MLTPKKFFEGGQDACAEADSAAAPPSPTPLARMSSAHDAQTSAIMQQLRTMQQRMDEHFDELRDEMKQERNELRNELRSEMQQWRLD